MKNLKVETLSNLLKVTQPVSSEGEIGAPSPESEYTAFNIFAALFDRGKKGYYVSTILSYFWQRMPPRVGWEEHSDRARKECSMEEGCHCEKVVRILV